MNESQSQPINSPASPAIVKPVEKKKLSVTYLIFGIIILILIAVSGFLEFQNMKLMKEVDGMKKVAAVTPTPAATTGWKIYNDSNGEFSFEYPYDWKQSPISYGGDSSIVNFIDPTGVYTLSFSIELNYSQVTGKSFKNIVDYLGLSSITQPTEKVDGQDAIQDLPAAGRENSVDAKFFSLDSKNIYIMELDTTNNTATAQDIFNQILSTFKFDN